MPKALTIATLFAVAGVLAAPARADVDCWVPMTQWQPRDVVAAFAAQNGWMLRRIKIDDGCYELVATDRAGAAVEVKVNPATLQVIAIEHRVDSHEHENSEPDATATTQ